MFKHKLGKRYRKSVGGRTKPFDMRELIIGVKTLEYLYL